MLRERLDPIVARLGGERRALIALIGIASVIGILALSWWATRPAWVPVFTDLPLESIGKLTDKLGEASIEYRLEDGGTKLLVPATDVARARVALARDGLPTGGRPGLELFDQPSWGMTDFTQRINYRRALEGELERTIAKMRGVESAEVHLALHEISTFRQPERRTAASVVIKLRNGAEPPADVVRGIAQLVASSVSGLSSDDVMVLDDSGRLLSVPNDGSGAGMASRQLAAQQDVEAYLRTKVEQIVTPITGPGNARVSVSASLNFDQVDRMTQSVDPERQALTTEQRAEIIPGPQGGAGSTNRSSSYENSRSLENFTGAIGTVRRLSVAVLVNEATAGLEGAERDAAAARQNAELEQIRALVAAAVGIDTTRGDVVSVTSFPFDGTRIASEKRTVWETARSFERPALLGLGLLLAFIVALRAIRSLRPTPAEVPSAPEEPEEPIEEPEEAPPEEVEVPEEEPEPVEAYIAPRDPLKERVEAVVLGRPELAARLVRTWLKET